MRLSRRSASAAGLVVALAVFIALFDWNWFRPAVERHFSERSGRSVQVADLHIGLGDDLQPVVRLRGLRVQNAPWATSTAPMAVAGEASFRFAWRSLWQRPRVVTDMRLIDAEVNLERRANGLRNWRLLHPDDTGPGRLLVMALRAERSRLSFVHHGVGLSLQATSSPLSGPVEPVRGEPLTRLIGFKGHFRGQPFEGETFTGDEITFQQTGRAIPLRGQVRVANNKLDVDGFAADLFKGTTGDADLRLRGPSLASLNALLAVGLPRSAPYTASGHLLKEAQAWSVTKLNAELGRSDLAGELNADLSTDTPRLQATLQSRRIDMADLTGPAAAPPRAIAREPLLLSRSLGLGGLRQFDAELDLRVQSLHAADLPPLQALRLHASLDGGQLALKPVQFGWAGGQVNGSFAVDASRQPAAARIELQWKKLRLEALLPDVPEPSRINGPLSGRLKLSGRGDSMADWLRSGSGTLAASMTGGSLPNKLDAKLALNGGKWLRALLSGHEPVAIHCGELLAELRDGNVRSRSLLLETAQTRIGGTAQLDLRSERFELWLDPQPKQRSLLALPSSIRVQGTLAAPGQAAITLESPRDFGAGEGCDPARPKGG